MKSLNVYLNFNGNCEEALNFYKRCLDGEISSIQRFGEAPMPSPEEQKNRIMHAMFKSEDISFMASDGMDDDLRIGNNISLSLNFTDTAEEERIFNKLAEGGKVSMPLADTFWDAKFGMLTDKYGINWMLNCPTPKK